MLCIQMLFQQPAIDNRGLASPFGYVPGAVPEGYRYCANG